MQGLHQPRWRQQALLTALVLWPIWSRIRVAHSLLASVAWPWAEKSPLLAPTPCTCGLPGKASGIVSIWETTRSL